ncbi:putative disease resistance protein [Quercus suber]|uniref:Disease resistance protein n=1 Tax=Quercus suber TaxID=58331 RepID=A0AAW0JL27_QUESU
MAVSVVSGVVTRLSDLLAQEAIYLYGVSDKAHELQIELTRIQCFLKDADARQNESAFVKNSVAEMKDLAYDAEDVIATYALTVASRKGRGIQKVLKRCACILGEGITVHQVGSKIDAMKTRISNLKQSFQEYGIIRESTIQAGGPSSLNEPQPEQRKTYPYLDDDPVGFNNDLDKLVEILLKEEEGTRVASIYGMGGLGKTTLARMVYNDPRVKQYFNGGCAWVCISQQCQKRPVWEEIMINLLPQSQNDQKEKIKGWSDGDLIKKLREVQQKQKCLVVLDDIWKIEDWNILCEAFPVNDTRSKILLTSRKNDVASLANPRVVHNLECLNEVNGLELFEKKAISWRSATVQIGKVRRLAIISKSGENSIKGIKFNEYPYLRSLLHLPPPGPESYFKESRFKKFKLVRVLHLENFNNHQRKLPKDIRCLIHLRYLSLKGSTINEVPSSIGNLRCLETLDLRIGQRYDCSLLDYIHLICGKLELANLSYLHTLVNVQPKTIQIPTWFELNRLRVLKVRNNKRAHDAMQMLISGCPLVEKLNLCSLVKKLPEAHQFSPNIAKLTLELTHLKEDPMPTLEKLPNLKILRLRYDSFVGKDMVCSEGGFPLLQYLLLQTLVSLEEWRVEEGAMPSLCHLTIEHCYNLKSIPDGLRFVTTLRELEINDEDRLHEVKHVPSLVSENCDREFQKLKIDDEDRLHEVKHVPSLVSENCDREFQELKIDDEDRLHEIRNNSRRKMQASQDEFVEECLRTLAQAERQSIEAEHWRTCE